MQAAPVDELFQRDGDGGPIERLSLAEANRERRHDRQQGHAVLAGAHGVQRDQDLRRAQQPLPCAARVCNFKG